MQSAKRNAVKYCNAFISHCAYFYFVNEDCIDLGKLTEAQRNNYECIEATLIYFDPDEVDMLRNVFTSGLPLAEAMAVLNKKGETGWFVIRKFIKLAATYRGLI